MFRVHAFNGYLIEDQYNGQGEMQQKNKLSTDYSKTVSKLHSSHKLVDFEDERHCRIPSVQISLENWDDFDPLLTDYDINIRL